jgi:hypothetical protein
MPTVRTRTVKASGGDYASLAAWTAGEATDLVAADEIRQAECYGFVDTASVTLTGWTTDATRYVRIYTPPSARHDGRWSLGKYRLEVAGGGVALTTDGVNHLRIEGLQIKNTASSGSGNHLISVSNTSGDARISKCLLRGVFTSTATGSGVSQTGVTSIARYWNNVVYDIVNAANVLVGIAVNDAGGVAYLYNNTLQNCRYPVYANNSPTVVLKNCLAQACGLNFTSDPGLFDASSTNNASDTGTAPGSNPRSGSAVFVDAAGDDFHLSPLDTLAEDFGATLVADANLAFSDDVVGVPRARLWDIGAFEVSTPFITSLGGRRMR